MKIEQNSAKKSKQHTVYKNKDGKRVPGTTTITSVMAKPALVNWANNLGLQGINVSQYVDDLAEIGSLAHYMIECHIKSKIEGRKIEPDFSDSTPNQIGSAENCFIKFLYWEERNKPEYLESELELVSEQYQFGGTIDCYAKINSKRTLLDFKTCKALYDEHFTQVAGGYQIVMLENNRAIDEIRIVRVGRTEEEGHEAEDRLAQQSEEHKKRFLLCRELYESNKKLGKQ